MKLYLLPGILLAMLSIFSLTACTQPTPGYPSAIPTSPSQTPTPMPTPEPTSMPEARDGVNLVEALGLDATTRIDILNLMQPPAAGGNADADAITDPAMLAKIIASLDVALPLRERTPCDAVFVLRFRLEGDKPQEFDYGCNPGAPDFLRGYQSLWSGQEALTPASFDALMAPYLRASFRNPANGMPPDETPPATPSLD